MRKIRNLGSLILLSFIMNSCNENNHTSTIELKKLNYPSASAVEYYNDRLYIMGDDAPNMLILDTNFNTSDSISIVLHTGYRIPKASKPDLEASAIYYINNEPVIFLFGSGSLDPFRNAGWRYNLRTRTKEYRYLYPLYSMIKKSGVEQINIEGAAFVTDKLILVNRGNKSSPNNHFIVIDYDVFKNNSNFYFRVIPFELQKDNASFKGISGLCFDKQSDQLILTVSTEDTRGVFEDGAIGRSYLWIINDISKQLDRHTLKPDKIIDLEEADPGFKGQKIESATIIEETNDFIRLVLVADNDDGSSTIFKMSIKRD